MTNLLLLYSEREDKKHKEHPDKTCFFARPFVSLRKETCFSTTVKKLLVCLQGTLIFVLM